MSFVEKNLIDQIALNGQREKEKMEANLVQHLSFKADCLKTAYLATFKLRSAFK